jgi:hypothetical protein
MAKKVGDGGWRRLFLLFFLIVLFFLFTFSEVE